MAKVTILLETKTRDKLKTLGRKGQTYDQLLLELITEHHHHQLKQKEGNVSLGMSAVSKILTV
jgi:hypothetical protein